MSNTLSIPTKETAPARGAGALGRWGPLTEDSVETYTLKLREGIAAGV